MKKLNKHIAILFITVLLFFISGCYPLPIGTERPVNFVNNATLDKLIGEKSTTVLNTIGNPDFTLYNEHVRYYIYPAWGEEKQLAMMLYMPFWYFEDEKGKLYCLSLEFDSSDTFNKYKLDYFSKAWRAWKGREECIIKFFAEEELKNLTIINHRDEIRINK